MINNNFGYNFSPLNIFTAASPIMIYKIVQTGPKTQLGRLKDGLLSETYQEKSLILTKYPDKNPNPRHISIESNFKQ